MISFIDSFISELLHIVNEISVYLLLGFLFAGLLHVYFPKNKIKKYLGGSNLKSVLYASLLGVPLPLCSCGVIPTGVSLNKEGASKSASISFLISTPQTGIDSILVTYSLMGLPFAIFRTIIAFVAGIFGGYLSVLMKNDSNNNFKNINNENQSEIIENRFKKIFKYGFFYLMEDIVKWLVIGIFIAVFITVIIPDNFFETYINNNILGMIIMLLISIPMYICATGSVPIAAALILKGLSPGAALVFLMSGPATNSATITVITKVFGLKTTLIYLFSIIFISILSGLMLDNLFPDMISININFSEHNEWFYYIKIISSIILVLLIIRALYFKYFSKNLNIIEKMEHKLIVEGMTCNHCKANIERNISQIKGVNSVEVDLTNKIVKINGEFNLQEVINKIEELGYKYKG